jgi:DNA-binding response OmpR family regulator
MADGRLLVIEDERDIGLLIEGVAQSMGFETRVVRALVDLWDAIDTFRPTAILADLTVVGGKGSDVITRLAESSTGALIVIMSGSGYRRAAELVAENLGLKVAGILDKPFRVVQLRSVLHSLLFADATGRDDAHKGSSVGR